MRIRLLLVGLASAFFLVSPLAGVASAAESESGQNIEHASEECIGILEGGGSINDCQEAPSPILPEPNEIIWGSIAFGILLVVFWKFAPPPVRNTMQAREDRIRGDLERAERSKGEAESVLGEYRAQLADARAEAGRIIDEARQAADQVRRDLLVRAEADAAELRARAADDVRLASERAMVDLHSRVGELSIQLAEKIVERSLDRDTQMRLVESYIDQVGSN